MRWVRRLSGDVQNLDRQSNIIRLRPFQDVNLTDFSPMHMRAIVDERPSSNSGVDGVQEHGVSKMENVGGREVLKLGP